MGLTESKYERLDAIERCLARRPSGRHFSQRLEDLPDGSCLFTVRVGSTMEMKPWIRQWGAAVTVVAPEDLRAELVAEVRAMARAYGLPLREEEV